MLLIELYYTMYTILRDSIKWIKLCFNGIQLLELYYGTNVTL